MVDIRYHSRRSADALERLAKTQKASAVPETPTIAKRIRPLTEQASTEL